ncbi:phosphoribosyltransferase [Janthinobacterium sp. 17J80-10]|uniref:phosphoribosyltransferase n=1 Tax=Janthinobacterium sp. 17J80-10 TaxID=2497863 RepID=UPI0010052C0B|nr:phosphoribosyltransferase [Janthinobacterium sp. 17J80-10]QAU34751.1 phosphoribosyltransferase [Janthinobacterium sp. 17J80-10]
MNVLHRFKNREEAGALLAQRLAAYAGRDDVLILALPRGGVPVGFAIAQALGLPLDIMLVRKLGVPGHEEYAMGAIASAGASILHRDVINSLGITMATVEQVKRREAAELERRERLYRARRPPPSMQGRTVILVDDGLATGATMQAALQAARAGKPARVIIAVPVAPPETCHSLQGQADDIVCLQSPEFFQAVGQWYEHFDQTSDEEVIELLGRADRALAQRAARAPI